MTSAEKKCFGASKYENFLGDDTPLPPYKACAFGTHNNFSPPPPTPLPVYGPAMGLL